MKILWVSPFFLHPTDRGGQIRTLGTLKELHKRHEVHFCALNASSNTEGPQRAGEYSTRSFAVPHDPIPRASLRILPQLFQAIFSPIPLAVSRYHSTALERVIAERLAEERYDSVVCDFLACAPNFREMEPAVLFQHNVETTIWQRHAEQTSSSLRRRFFGLQARKMAAYEAQICRRSRFVIAVSDIDASRMRNDFSVTRVASVSTGVDVDSLAPPPHADPVSDLIFSGSMDWLPNIDAMEFFLKEIFPLVQQELPRTTLTIAGRAPDERVLRAAEGVAGVTVTGSVPDMRPYLWGSKVSIIPLRIGGGTRLKVYESMAAGVPIVSTTIGAEGLTYTPGRDLLIGDTPQQFAQQCVRMLRDADDRAAVAGNAMRLVRDNFSWAAVTQEFEAILQQNRL
ncbi:glycosyltransferase family 4 protein [Terriglobus roseus]|uniref:Glycosyltransferase involved in cell wall bisynthesis n=1 Tax=Terriglobus roseus TaxID=392734 RepID=A0A1H4JPC0_9BACT|nr:glycosyltransferase family 4 protein [Terriglobus roseus]SEB47825.1 Glycosyltransferase involved in cell wall bisynthesis [Terriglobus roseus]